MAVSGTTSGPELLVELDRAGQEPLHRQLANGLRTAIRRHGSGTRVATVDFLPGSPDLSSFPRNAWLRTLRQGLAEIGSDSFGRRPARASCRARRRRSRCSDVHFRTVRCRWRWKTLDSGCIGWCCATTASNRSPFRSTTTASMSLRWRTAARRRGCPRSGHLRRFDEQDAGARTAHRVDGDATSARRRGQAVEKPGRHGELGDGSDCIRATAGIGWLRPTSTADAPSLSDPPERSAGSPGPLPPAGDGPWRRRRRPPHGPVPRRLPGRRPGPAGGGDAGERRAAGALLCGSGGGSPGVAAGLRQPDRVADQRWGFRRSPGRRGDAEPQARPIRRGGCAAAAEA